MNLNINTLLLSVLLTSSTYSIEQKKIEIDETPADIYKEVLRMIKECRKRCSLPTNMLSKEKCREECGKDYLQQREDYLARKYTSLCTGKSFSKEWRYRTEAQKKRDNYKTGEKNVYWKNNAIDSCVQNCLTQHVKNIQIFKNHFGIDQPSK